MPGPHEPEKAPVPGTQGGQTLKNLFPRRLPNFIDSLSFRGGSSRKPKTRKLAAWSLFASIIDLAVVLIISLLFVITSSLMAHQMSGASLREVYLTGSGMPLVGLLYLITFSIYLVVARWFQGFTLGEWCCDIRLGTPEDFLQSHYKYRVLMRWILTLATGIVLFPLLAILTGSDVLGKICKLRIYSDS